MKTSYSVSRDDFKPPIPSVELALFTFALQANETKEKLSLMGYEIPETFEVIHNNNGDDPPDIEALELGWECTEFPPNQSAMEVVYQQRGSKAMAIPPICQTGCEVKDIHTRLDLEQIKPSFYDPNEEIRELESIFLNKIIGGSKSKDISGNDVLLLDARNNDGGNAMAEEAIRKALKKKQPRFIKIILLVGTRLYRVGDNRPFPEVVWLFPDCE
jgi:hypothetical protein